MMVYRDGITAILVGLLVGIGWVLLVAPRPTVPTYAERPSAQRAEDALQEIRARQIDVLDGRAWHTTTEMPLFPAYPPPPARVRAEARVTPVFARETQFVGTAR